MKKIAFRLSGALMVAIVVAGCTDDPTEALRQGADRVTTSLSYIEILIGDSIVVTAQTKDAQGNALPELPEITSANISVASVSVDESVSGRPIPETLFNILANGFGQTTVTASGGGYTKEIVVQTWPASIAIGGVTDIDGTSNGLQVGSGTAIAMTTTALNSGDDPFTVGNDGLYYTWSTSAATIASVDAVGAGTTAAPGLAVITVVSYQLSDSAATGAIGELAIEVVPGTLTGALSATSGLAGAAVTITDAAGLYDGNTVGTFDLLDPVGIAPGPANTATSFTFVTPPNLSVGDHTLVISGIGSAELAQAVSYAVTAGADPDLWESDTFGLGAPAIVQSGRYFGTISPTDIDDFFLIDNTAGTSDMEVHMDIDWSSGAVDLDVLVYTAAGGFVSCMTTATSNYAACTGAKPEAGDQTVPAGEAYVFIIDFYSGPGPAAFSMDITID